MRAVTVPQVNPNEDAVTLVRILVTERQRVTTGTELFVIETTKATFTVEAPADGYVRDVPAQAGGTFKVGARLCWIAESRDAPLPSVAAEDAQLAPRITRKARELAERHGVRWQELEATDIITERDISALLGDAAPRQPTASSSAIPFLVLGAGGHAKVLTELIGHYRHFTLKGFLDDNVPRGTIIDGVPVLGRPEEFGEIAGGEPHCAALAFGLVSLDAALRARVFAACRRAGAMMPPLVHPSASVAPSARLGAGVQVLAGAIVGPDTVLGDGVVVNSNAVVSHDCHVDALTHVASGAVLAGEVTVGARSLIGMGVTVFVGVRVGDDVVVRNGLHVFRDVPSGAHLRERRPEGG